MKSQDPPGGGGVTFALPRLHPWGWGRGPFRAQDRLKGMALRQELSWFPSELVISSLTTINCSGGAPVDSNMETGRFKSLQTRRRTGFFWEWGGGWGRLSPDFVYFPLKSNQPL